MMLKRNTMRNVSTGTATSSTTNTTTKATSNAVAESKRAARRQLRWSNTAHQGCCSWAGAVLVLEFHMLYAVYQSNLRRLPIWSASPRYCFSSNIHALEKWNPP